MHCSRVPDQDRPCQGPGYHGWPWLSPSRALSLPLSCLLLTSLSPLNHKIPLRLTPHRTTPALQGRLGGKRHSASHTCTSVDQKMANVRQGGKNRVWEATPTHLLVTWNTHLHVNWGRWGWPQGMCVVQCLFLSCSHDTRKHWARTFPIVCCAARSTASPADCMESTAGFLPTADSISSYSFLISSENSSQFHAGKEALAPVLQSFPQQVCCFDYPWSFTLVSYSLMEALSCLARGRWGLQFLAEHGCRCAVPALKLQLAVVLCRALAWN